MVERDALVGSAAVDKRSEASVPERRRLAPVARGKRLKQDLVGARLGERMGDSRRNIISCIRQLVIPILRRLAKRLHKYKQKQDDYRSFNCGFHGARHFWPTWVQPSWMRVPYALYYITNPPTM